MMGASDWLGGARVLGQIGRFGPIACLSLLGLISPIGPASLIRPITPKPNPKPQPRFQIVQKGGAWWFQGPDGKPFFSFGVCCVEPGTTFADYDLNNPSYAAFKYYPDGKTAWATDVEQRLKSWGFNTIGAWSDAKDLRQVKDPELRFTPILHMGSGAGAPWRDMWDPAVVKLMNDIARDQIKELSAEPRVIGYFSDNEQGWWNGALFEWAWKGPFTRAKLVDQLRSRYRTWKAVSVDFDAVGAASFTDLAKGGRLFLHPGGRGIEAIHAYIEMLSDRYYSLCNSIIKKYDPRALYLGDRYISNFYPEVARSAGRYADVVSTNLNADWNDGSFTPFYLPSLHRLTKKPLMITEYYMAAKENRTGNKNDSSGFPVVETQLQRAEGFRTSTDTMLSTSYVLGAHWFQYYDEPKNGRGDGENYNMGLVDVYNEPYEELTETAAKINLMERPRQLLWGSATVPEIAGADAPDLQKWPRSLAYVEPNIPSDRGDAFVSWDPDAVYLALYWNEDRFSEALYREGKIPRVDEPVVSIVGLKNRASVRFLEKKPEIVGHVELLSLKMGVRNTAIIRIPASALGLSELKPDMKMPFDVLLQTRSRAYAIHWRCSKKLSNETNP